MANSIVFSSAGSVYQEIENYFYDYPYIGVIPGLSVSTDNYYNSLSQISEISASTSNIIFQANNGALELSFQEGFQGRGYYGEIIGNFPNAYMGTKYFGSDTSDALVNGYLSLTLSGAYYNDKMQMLPHCNICEWRYNRIRWIKCTSKSIR